MAIHRCRGWRRWVVVLAVLGRGALSDDDLVQSTVREAQAGEEVTEMDPAELEKRRPRTRRSVHPLTDLPPAGEFATTRAHLISHSGLTWRVGEEVTVACHFSHALNKEVNVTGLMGSLNSPVRFGYYLQNFSYDGESYVARAREDVTLDYTFALADTLDAGQWQVALTVYYSVGRYLYSSTFFNETVTLVQPTSGSSWLLAFATLLGLLAALYVAKDQILATPTAGKKPDPAQTQARAEALAAAQAAAADDQSWTAHLDAARAPGSRKPSKKASKSKKK